MYKAIFKIGERVDFCGAAGTIVDGRFSEGGTQYQVDFDGKFDPPWLYEEYIRPHHVEASIRPNYADLPFDALEEVCLVFQHGAGKYGKDDWAKPDNQSGDHVHKALGHIIHHLRGKQRETGEGGSGYRHLSHAAARLLMAIGKEIRNAS